MPRAAAKSNELVAVRKKRENMIRKDQYTLLLLLFGKETYLTHYDGIRVLCIDLERPLLRPRQRERRIW